MDAVSVDDMSKRHLELTIQENDKYLQVHSPASAGARTHEQIHGQGTRQMAKGRGTVSSFFLMNISTATLLFPEFLVASPNIIVDVL